MLTDNLGMTQHDLEQFLSDQGEDRRGAIFALLLRVYFAE